MTNPVLFIAGEDLSSRPGVHCRRVDELAGATRAGSWLLKTWRWTQQLPPIELP